MLIDIVGVLIWEHSLLDVWLAVCLIINGIHTFWSQDLSISLTIGSWLNKTPNDSTLLGRTSRRFLWCCCFSSREVFTFPSYFFLPSPLHPSFSGMWRPPMALSYTRSTFGCFTFSQAFSVTVLSRGLRFWVAIFYPQAFFTLFSFSDIFGTVCDSDVGRNTSSRILLCACLHRVVPSGWPMDLNYPYCSYKTIDLLIAPVSHEV